MIVRFQLTLRHDEMRVAPLKVVTLVSESSKPWEAIAARNLVIRLLFFSKIILIQSLYPSTLVTSTFSCSQQKEQKHWFQLVTH